MDASPLKAGLSPLFLSVPPMFERAVGYAGDCRFVAFYWGSCDELCFTDDSLVSGTIDSAGWLIFMSHPFVRLHLRCLDFGSADCPSRHLLLLDRVERRFHVGEREKVESFLEDCARLGSRVGAPAQVKSTVTLDEFIAMAGNLEELLGRELAPAGMMRRLEERQAVCSELREWLKRLD